MTFTKAMALCLAALLSCTLLSACADKGDGEGTTEALLPETAVPIDADLRTDYTSDPATVELLDAMRASFDELLPSPAEDFKFTVANGEATVTDYLGTAANVRIPDRVDGTPVTAIAEAAFSDKTAVKKLYIPDGVTTLGKGCLKDCDLTALRTPVVGDGGENAYLGYLFGASTYADNARDVPASLAYLELGSTVTVLADHALFDCNDLMLVQFPETLRTVGVYALYNCNSLLALNVSGLTALGDYALYGCTALTRLEFGEEMASFGLGALQGCTGLRHLTLPFVGGSAEEHTYLGYVFGAEVPDFAREHYPTYLTSVTVLDGCTALGNYAFYECLPLQSVQLGAGVQSVGVRAFAGCERLAEVNFPDALQTVRENAFFGCLSLKEVHFGEGSGLTSLGVNAFYSCDALTRVILPPSLKSLPASCFADCVSLSEIDLGGVSEIGANAFYHCISLPKEE